MKQQVACHRNMGVDGPAVWTKMAGMQHYRLYHVSQSGRILSAQEMDCEHDLDALAKAEQVREQCNVELWQDIRLLARLKKRDKH